MRALVLFATMFSLSTAWAYPEVIRNGKDLLLVENGKLRKIGVVSAEPFQMATLEDSIVTREGNDIHRWTEADGKWAKIGVVSAEPFDMISLGNLLVTREGKDLHKWESAWSKIGVVSAEPFEMWLGGGRLYTSEGGVVHSWDPVTGAWTRY